VKNSSPTVVWFVNLLKKDLYIKQSCCAKMLGFNPILPTSNLYSDYATSYVAKILFPNDLRRNFDSRKVAFHF
jgi:hypothetical protein